MPHIIVIRHPYQQSFLTPVKLMTYQKTPPHIPALPENNARTRFLLEAERLPLFEACRASALPKLYLLALLAITTGARKGELLNLRWADIDLERFRAYVATTKNGQPKVLPLTSSVINELKRCVDSEHSMLSLER